MSDKQIDVKPGDVDDETTQIANDMRRAHLARTAKPAKPVNKVVLGPDTLFEVCKGSLETRPVGAQIYGRDLNPHAELDNLVAHGKLKVVEE